MRFPTLNIPTASDVVVMHFEDLILDGVLEPGTDIPPERKLAETLGVSRTTLRDALARLQSKGLLIHTETGTQVHNIFDIMIRKPLDSLYSVDPDDLLEMWTEMACSATELAADRLTSQDLLFFKNQLVAIENSFHQEPSHIRLVDIKNLMNGIALASYNFVLLQVFKFLNDLVFGRSENSLLSGQHEKIIETITLLIEALERSDLKLASSKTKELAKALVNSENTELHKQMKLSDEVNVDQTTLTSQDLALIEIRKMLRSREFNYGDKLPNNKDLAKRFGLPVGAIKSAFSTLSTLGEVEVGNRGGVIFKDPNSSCPQDTLVDLINGRIHALEAIFEFRIILERMTSYLAAKRRSKSDIALMDDKLKSLEATTDLDEKDPAVIDIEFHAAIAAASGNDALQAIGHEMITFFRRTTRGWLKKHDKRLGSLIEIHQQHRKVFAAIKKSDHNAARDAMEEHLRYVIKMLHVFKNTDQRIEIASLRFRD